jgi:hypothetical protein
MKVIEGVLQIRRLFGYNALAWTLLAVQHYSYAVCFGQKFRWQSLIRDPLSIYSTCLMY